MNRWQLNVIIVFSLVLPSLRHSCLSCRCGRVSRRSASMWRGPAVPQSARLLSLWMPNRLPVWLIPEDVCRYVGCHTRHHAAEAHMLHKFLPSLPFRPPLLLHSFALLYTLFFAYLLCCSWLLFCGCCCSPPPAPAVATGPITPPAAEDSLLSCPCCCRCSLCLWFTVLWLSW